MASLRDLVKKHGFGIRVKSGNLDNPNPFIIEQEKQRFHSFNVGNCYLCKYDDGRKGLVLQDGGIVKDYQVVE